MNMENLKLILSLIFLVVGIVFWFRSHVFRYYVKFIYYNVVVVIFTGIWLIPYCLLKPRDVKNLIPVAASWNFLFKHMGIHPEIVDEHHLQSDKSYILVCNHQSSLDLIPMMRVLPERCTMLAKKELLYAGTFGVAAWLCGVVYIDRMSSQKSRETMRRTAEDIVKKDLKMWIFPEGTRSLGDVMLPFKKGAFHLAVQSQVPIVPVVVSSYQHLLNYKRRYFESGKVIVQCLEPISTEGKTAEDVNALATETRRIMMEVFTKNSVAAGAMSPAAAAAANEKVATGQ